MYFILESREVEQFDGCLIQLYFKIKRGQTRYFVERSKTKEHFLVTISIQIAHVITDNETKNETR